MTISLLCASAGAANPGNAIAAAATATDRVNLFIHSSQKTVVRWQSR
jgi:hypothetical protein